MQTWLQFPNNKVILNNVHVYSDCHFISFLVSYVYSYFIKFRSDSVQIP
jgi:hypothetical protein